MSIRFFWFAFLFFCVPRFAAAQAQVAETNWKSPVERYGQLRVQGNRIIGQNGKPVVLRGISLPASQQMGNFYNEDAVAWLQSDWGCDVVRVAMGIEPNGYLANPQREADKVKAVVEAAIDLGMYVIIGWHDRDAPRHRVPAQQFFAEAAQYYGQYPNVIYETYSEPADTYSWVENIKPYHTAIIQNIREHDPDNLILCSTPHQDQGPDVAARDPLPFTNIVYALNFAASARHPAVHEAVAGAIQNGAAFFVTQFGTTQGNNAQVGDKQTDDIEKIDVEATQNEWKFLEEHQISWCLWPLAGNKESSAALRSSADSGGGWRESDLTPTGILVRNELRRYAEQEMNEHVINEHVINEHVMNE